MLRLPIKLNQTNKYSNTKVWLDNIEFDSKKEARRYSQLKLLIRAKEIMDLKMQVPFELQEGFRDNQKNWRRPIIYIADFTYIDIRTPFLIIEDTKGFRTPDYKIKKKLFLHKYPNIIFKEI